MLRWSLRPAFFVLLMILVAACSGSGCSGCAGCGMTPLPDGFPQASVIDNSASVRLTRPGLDFIGNNLGAVAGDVLGDGGASSDGGSTPPITFAIGASSTNLAGLATANICQSPSAGQCVADINLPGAKLHIDSIASTNGPNMEPALQITGTVPVKIDDIPVGLAIFGINACSLDIGVGNGGCNGNSPAVTYADVPVTAILPIINETISPRDGYAIIDTDQRGRQREHRLEHRADLRRPLLRAWPTLLKSTIVSQITGPLTSTLKSQLQKQLCTKANPHDHPAVPRRHASTTTPGPASSRRAPTPACPRCSASTGTWTSAPWSPSTRRATPPRSTWCSPRPALRQTAAQLRARPGPHQRDVHHAEPRADHRLHAQRADARDARRHAPPRPRPERHDQLRARSPRTPSPRASPSRTQLQTDDVAPLVARRRARPRARPVRTLPHLRDDQRLQQRHAVPGHLHRAVRRSAPATSAPSCRRSRT